MIDLWTVGFGLACMATLGSAVRSGDHSAIFVAALCTASWAVYNIGWYRDAAYLWPAIDLLVAMLAVDLWMAGRQKWQHQFMVLAVMQILLHVANSLTQDAYFVIYAHALNATFAAELIVVARAGRRDIGRLDLRDYLRCLGVARHRSSQGR